MLVRWNPHRELNAFRRQMEYLFDRTPNPNRDGEAAENGRTSSDWSPTVDIYEDEDAYTVTAEVPGLTQQDIKVHVEEQRLTIEGERKREHEDKQDGYHRVERSYGKFIRGFALPEHVDVDKIQAQCSEGVLRVTLPKREDVRPKQIEVQVN